jgi:hypothetical protein
MEVSRPVLSVGTSLIFRGLIPRRYLLADYHAVVSRYSFGQGSLRPKLTAVSSLQ